MKLKSLMLPVATAAALLFSSASYAGLCLDSNGATYNCQESKVAKLVYLKVKHKENFLYFFNVEDLLTYQEPGITPPRRNNHGGVIEDHTPANGDHILSIEEVITAYMHNDQDTIETYKKKKKTNSNMLLSIAEAAIDGAGEFIGAVKDFAISRGYTKLELTLKGEDGKRVDVEWDLEKDDIDFDITSAKSVKEEEEKAKKDQKGSSNAPIDPAANALTAAELKQLVDDYNSSLPHGTVRIIDHRM